MKMDVSIDTLAAAPTTVCVPQMMTMRHSRSCKDASTPPRYAMSGFYIEMGGFLYAAAIDDRHRTDQRRHDMAAEFQ